MKSKFPKILFLFVACIFLTSQQLVWATKEVNSDSSSNSSGSQKGGSPEISSKVTSNSIEFEINPHKGNHYKIYRDGKKVWEGNQKEVIDKNLEPDYS